MAERGAFAQWLKKYLSGAMGAVTIAIATITALTVSTIAVQSGGSLVIDASGDVTLNGDGLAKASGTESLTLSVLGTGDLALASADDLTITTTGDDIALAANDALTVASAGGAGGSLSCDSTGVTIGAASAGDDFSISAADDGQVSAGDQLLLSGVTSSRLESDASANFLQCSASGVTITAGAAGDDISLVTTGGDDLLITLADDYTATGDVFGTTAVTSITDAVTSGGSLAAVAGGVTITAGAAGDDISLVTTGGDDLLITLADDYTATGDVFDTTAITASQTTVTGGGALNLTTGGSSLLANSSGDDISLSAADDITLTATAGPLLLIGASGQLQIDSTGGIFNAPVSAALVAGGTAFQAAVTVQTLTTVFTPGSTAEAIADTFVIPASAWTTTGESLVVTAWGTAAGNTNNKTLALRLGTSGNCATGTVLPGVNFNLANDQVWQIEWIIYRSAANTQLGWVKAFGNAGSTAGTVFARVDLSAARTESGILNACVTVTNETSASDLSVSGILWRWL